MRQMQAKIEQARTAQRVRLRHDSIPVYAAISAKQPSDITEPL
jgi:hypothetical protein